MYLDIILLVPSLRFQIYNIISCNMPCDYGYMSLYYSRNKEKIKSKSK